MRKRVHEYFHRLMWIVESTIEPKFNAGDKEHGHKGMLWDMPQDELLRNFEDEIKDMIVYWAEIKRREHDKE